MKVKAYVLTSWPGGLEFSFVSKGPQGQIEKWVQFEPLGHAQDGSEIWNLAYGDLNAARDDFSDLSVSRNGDMEQVLASVAAAVRLFLLSRPPGAWIYFSGSTPSRSRLYRMMIRKHYEELSEFAEIKGVYGKRIEKFKENEQCEKFFCRRLEK